MTEQEEARFRAACQFPRRLRDRALRLHLAELGWRSGQDVVIAFDSDPLAKVLGLMVTNGTSSPCLVAIPDAAERFGFRFLHASVASAVEREAVEIAPTTSIGMIYSSLQPCVSYLPGGWAPAVAFERALAAT